MFLAKVTKIVGRETSKEVKKIGNQPKDQADEVLEDELTRLKKEFEQAKEEGSPQYLEKLMAVAVKEKKEFDKQRPSILKSIDAFFANGHSIIREDILLSCLNTKPLNLGAIHKGADTLEFVGGKFVRKNEQSPWEYEGKDDKLQDRIQRFYNKKQYKQDKNKLKALDKYFVAAIASIKMAIKVRDSKDGDNNLISEGGKKLKKSKILAFNQLPGITCPGKGECFNWCFALSGHTAMPVQMKSYAENLGATERDDFVDKVSGQIKRMRPTNSVLRGRKWKKIIRIHAYGDFHTPKYVEKWREIARRNADCFFYAYTKSFYMKPMQEWMKEIEDGTVKNVKIIQSLGGKFDHKVDYTKPHAKVFDSIDQIKENFNPKTGEEYKHCSDDDIVAANPKHKNIAIEKHGETQCSSSAFCPMSKTTAAVNKKKKEELPLIHMVDQIDLPHNLHPLQLADVIHLGSHVTPSEHARDFGRHMNYAAEQAKFSNQVTSKYKVKVG